jgi:transcriptional regulator with XRE-family HTH domain
MDYSRIFRVNLEKRMVALALTKQVLAKRADVSVSFVSDISNGTANPSLKTMAALSGALNVPLPLMLLDPDGPIWNFLNSWDTAATFNSRSVKPGFEEVHAVLPAVKAFTVKKWVEEARVKKRK